MKVRVIESGHSGSAINEGFSKHGFVLDVVGLLTFCRRKSHSKQHVILIKLILNHDKYDIMYKYDSFTCFIFVVFIFTCKLFQNIYYMICFHFIMIIYKVC